MRVTIRTFALWSNCFAKLRKKRAGATTIHQKKTFSNSGVINRGQLPGAPGLAVFETWDSIAA